MDKNSHPDIELTNALLKEKLLRAMPKTGNYPTPIDGFGIYRRDGEHEPENCFYRPLISLVVQGSKRSLMGKQEYLYGGGQSLVAAVDMPSVNYVTAASANAPFLSMVVDLDLFLIAQLAAETKTPVVFASTPPKGVSVAEADPDLMGAFLRLLELLETPQQIPVMAPMIIREIHYRLLIGAHGEYLRNTSTLGSKSNQIAQAISWLRTNYTQPLQVEKMARNANMAPSTFHRHFKQVTSLSPVQFQKRLRLYEAQRLMLTQNQDATHAAFAVGYESPTQFNREYKRMFGDPPHRDVSRMR